MSRPKPHTDTCFTLRCSPSVEIRAPSFRLHPVCRSAAVRGSAFGAHTQGWLHCGGGLWHHKFELRACVVGLAIVAAPGKLSPPNALHLTPVPPPRDCNPRVPCPGSPASAGLGRSACHMNANGVPNQSPGLPRSGYPGIAVVVLSSTPTGLCLRGEGDVGGTPLGFDGMGRGLPRVGARASRQPWAPRRNAVGVRCSPSSFAPIAEPDRSTQRRGRFHFRSRGRRHWPGVG